MSKEYYKISGNFVEVFEALGLPDGFYTASTAEEGKATLIKDTVDRPTATASTRLANIDFQKLWAGDENAPVDHRYYVQGLHNSEAIDMLTQVSDPFSRYLKAGILPVADKSGHPRAKHGVGFIDKDNKPAGVFISYLDHINDYKRGDEQGSLQNIRKHVLICRIHNTTGKPTERQVTVYVSKTLLERDPVYYAQGTDLLKAKSIARLDKMELRNEILTFVNEEPDLRPVLGNLFDAFGNLQEAQLQQTASLFEADGRTMLGISDKIIRVQDELDRLIAKLPAQIGQLTKAKLNKQLAGRYEVFDSENSIAGFMNEAKAIVGVVARQQWDNFDEKDLEKVFELQSYFDDLVSELPAEIRVLSKNKLNQQLASQHRSLKDQSAINDFKNNAQTFVRDLKQKSTQTELKGRRSTFALGSTAIAFTSVEALLVAALFYPPLMLALHISIALVKLVVFAKALGAAAVATDLSFLWFRATDHQALKQARKAKIDSLANELQVPTDIKGASTSRMLSGRLNTVEAVPRPLSPVSDATVPISERDRDMRVSGLDGETSNSGDESEYSIVLS